MKSIEASGRTKDEAVEQALGELGLQRSQVKVEVIEEATRGFLGMGGRPCRVRVAALGEGGGDPAAVLHDLLEIMGVEFQLETLQEDDGPRLRIISPRDDGLLIGRRGQTLDAIRHLTQRVVAAREGRNVVVNIDVGDYRERREERLRDRAREAVERARETGRSVTMEPMSAQDRRVVHLVLAEEEGLRTYTIGGGPRRRVVVAPEGEASYEEDFDDEPESAYDGVPDPGFRPSRLTEGGTDDGGGRREDDRSRRRPRRRRPRREEGTPRSGEARGERPSGETIAAAGDVTEDRTSAAGDHGEGRDGGAAAAPRRQHEHRRDDGRGRRERRPEGQGGRAREEGRDGEPSRSDRPRDERPRDDRRRGGRRRDERRRDGHRRDDRHGGDSWRDERPLGDAGHEEPAAVSLTEVPEVSDDSTEKPFSRDLANQILKMGDKASEKPATASRRRPRRR